MDHLSDPPAAHDEHGEYHPDFVPVEEKKVSFWRKLGGGSLTVSILVHAAILAVGVIWVVAVIPPPPEKKVDFNPGGGGGGSPSTQTNQTKQKKVVRNTASRVTAIGGASDLSLPEPDLSNTGMTSLGDLGSMAGGLGGAAGGGSGGGSGLGIGGGIGDGMGIGSGLGSFLGAKDPNANAMVGNFYDLKQNDKGEPTGLNVSQSITTVREFVASNWDERHLKDFFKADITLYQTKIWIPVMNAAEAPAAFECADQVKPSQWVLIYRGTVTAPESGTYRFVGAGDDIMAVRFDNDVVFDWGFTLATAPLNTFVDAWKFFSGKEENKQILDIFDKEYIIKSPIDIYPYQRTPSLNSQIGGLAAGKEFRVQAGQSYPIEILISEQPGGSFNAVLLVEKVGDAEKYPKDQSGSPIFPIFRTDDDIPLDSAGGNGLPPVNAAVGPWRIQQPGSGRRRI